MGSIFSILQMVITLPLLSLITSYSISFHPNRDFSIKTCPTLDKAIPELTISFNSDLLLAIPPPVPPRVYAGLTTTGYPISSAAFNASI